MSFGEVEQQTYFWLQLLNIIVLLLYLQAKIYMFLFIGKCDILIHEHIVQSLKIGWAFHWYNQFLHST